MRIDGYAPIENYAVIGDGRTAALVAKDGAIDWLCLPNLDSPSTFSALLDAARGGTFSLSPAIPFQSTRRYLPRTTVLETTFSTERSVRLLDAMTLPDDHRPDAGAGALDGGRRTVPMRWRCAPRFDYSRSQPRCRMAPWRSSLLSGNQAIGIMSWGAGPMFQDAGAEAEFEIAPVSVGLRYERVF
jgi:GH15 family glucan-1,4-alpha-glucosidase